MGIKVIHQVFSDEEYAKLLKAKGDKTWRALILELVKKEGIRTEPMQES